MVLTSLNLLRAADLTQCTNVTLDQLVFYYNTLSEVCNGDVIADEPFLLPQPSV